MLQSKADAVKAAAEQAMLAIHQQWDQYREAAEGLKTHYNVRRSGLWTGDCCVPAGEGLGVGWRIGLCAALPLARLQPLS